ncbi:hypothetical protein [Microbacterium soli]|uniref:DUF2993 domain-containing protein n=1 Tax=Microbacterium soli TaxID=446075 RepID=A0ABP7N750_9MICO
MSSPRHDPATGTPPQTSQAWPGDAAAVERRLRSELLNALDTELRVTGLDGIRTAVELDGTTLTHVLVDATGVRIDVHPAETGTGAADAGARNTGAGGPGAAAVADAASQADDILTRTSGKLRFARLMAAPVTVQGHDIHLDATVADLPFDWVEHTAPRDPERPETRYGVEDSPLPAHPTGSFTARMRLADIGPLLADIARPLLEPSGVRLRRLDASVHADRRQNVTLKGFASVRWKIFGATVRGTAVVHADRDGVLTVRKVRLRSGNPIIAIALHLARHRIRAVEGERLDLNAPDSAPDDAPTPASAERVLRVHDLRVRTGTDLEITGRIG